MRTCLGHEAIRLTSTVFFYTAYSLFKNTEKHNTIHTSHSHIYTCTHTILSSFLFGHLYFPIIYRCHSKCYSLFSLSDLVLTRNADLNDKKLIVLNPAEDELLLIGSLDRLYEVSFFQFAIGRDKFYVSRIHKDYWGVFIDLVHCLLTYSAIIFISDIIVREKMTLIHLS